MATNRYPIVSGPYEPEVWSADSTTAIYQGDVLKVSSNEVLPMATSTDNLTMIGVSLSYKPTSGVHRNDPIVVIPTRALECELEMELVTATTIAEGDKLAMATLTAGAQKVAKTSTDAVFFASEDKSSASKIRCRMLLNRTYGLGDAS